jgi:hypothetical protein
VSRHHAKRVMTSRPIHTAAIFLVTGLTKLSQPRAQLAAGPMGWADDVRAAWASRRFSPRSPRWAPR